MPVSVKDYLSSMSSVSSSTKAPATNSNDTKIQALLSQLIEAISYANSVDFRAKALNAQAPGSDLTGKQVLSNMKAQEKLVQQLAEGQKLSNNQTKELQATIDRFYDLIGAQEINYKEFAKNLEKFALQDLPEAVKTRLINDSRDAHMIGQEEKRSGGTVLPVLKRIRNLLEDSAENTKQFTKKLFVRLDEFKQGLLDSFKDLGDLIHDNGIGGILDQIANVINGIGMAWFALKPMFDEGNYKWGQLIKQGDNIRKFFKIMKEVGSFKKLNMLSGIGHVQKGVKDIVGVIKSFAQLPKEMKTLKNAFGFMKLAGTGAKSITKGFGKNFLKKIPGVGLALSIFMVVERWKKKDYTGALIELGSGIASIFPGIGTAISIGLDLINLGRDTGWFASVGKTATDKAKSFASSNSQNLLMSIPGIGPVYGIIKAVDFFRKGKKKEGLEMIGKSLMSIIPGGAFIADMLIDLLDLPDINPTASSSSSNSSGGKKSWKFWQRGGKGDANPIGGRGAAGSTAMLSSTEVGNRLGSASLNVAKSMGGTKSTHYCAKGVTRAFNKAFGESIGGDAYQMIAGLKSSKFGKKYFDYKGKANKMTFGKHDLPAGAVLGWNRYPGNAYGHIEIANGSGLLASDFYRDSSGILGTGYKKNNVYPEIFVPKGAKLPTKTSTADVDTSSANDASSSEAEVMEPEFTSLDDVAKAFQEFSNQVYGDLPTGTAEQMEYKFPELTSGDLSAGTPMASTASSASAMAKSKPSTGSFAQPAAAPMMPAMAQRQPDTMDTEIRDTDLALLNSILFS